MILKVSRLGVIKEAEVDLDKNLIIFCGPNNSGKTYLAYTIYGLFFFRNDVLGFEDSNEMTEFISQKQKNEIDLFSFLQKFYYKIERYIETFNERLPDVFATNRKLFQRAKLSLTISDWDKIKNRMKNTEIDFSSQIYDGLTIGLKKDYGSTICRYQVIWHENIKPSNILQDPDIFILAITFQYAIGSLIFPRSFIAPTERTAANIFSKELSIKRNELVDQLFELSSKNRIPQEDPLSFLSRRAKRYTLPLRTSLEISEDLHTLKQNESDYAYLADYLEQFILNGKISVSEEGAMYFTPDKAKGKKLELHLAGSLVKSLSSIVFYFRHIARSHEVLIIDEPELNLHPDNQRKIARFLARVVNAGFKVLISTHSDYVIRELNNLIMLNQNTEEAARLMDKFGYDKAELLDNNQVGVYLFNDSPRKGVEKIEVTESGFEVESIDRTIHELNESSQEIYLSLF